MTNMDIVMNMLRKTDTKELTLLVRDALSKAGVPYEEKPGGINFDGLSAPNPNEFKYIPSEWAPLIDLPRSEMIALIKEYPHLPFTHRFFSAGEYIYSNAAGDIYDENGYLFEDWHSEGPDRHDGIRRRTGGAWEHGWRICVPEQKHL